ncbi:MAG: cytochrome c3 family protein [Xanthomonadales bacterium]|jgi:predicted CXXCH cytochrome family protein|nr:cytochrome c3 family protein [Xanthomonadales bacterium]
MRWLIRKVERRARGQVQYEDFAFEGEELTIGRGADRVIAISDPRIALEHLAIRRVGKRIRIESQIAAGFRIGTDTIRQATLGLREVFEVGGQRFRMIDAPAGFDAAIEWSPIDRQELEARSVAERLPTTLAQTWLSRRGPSWILFTAMLILCLVLPVMAHYLGQRGVTQVAPVMHLWDTGPVANAHRYFANDCTSCHEGNFQVVQDAKCVACHQKTEAHADPHQFPLYEVTDARCAHCHRDHNGPQGLVLTEQRLCSDCHQDLSTRSAGKTQLIDVADFAGTAHPNFMLSLPAWDAAGKYAPVQSRMGTGPLVENSGLKFPHDKHLGTVDGLASPRGKQQLDCGSCHVADAGGLAMKPIDFEAHCQDCHRLTFDRAAGDRQVPHADVPAVLAMLTEYYAGRAIDGSWDDPAAPVTVRTRRRPGQEMTPTERNEALEWARNNAARTTRTLFEGQACGVCHTVTPERSESGALSYKVAPVRIAGVWFERAKFSHAAHTVMDCAHCHAAKLSKAAQDVLIPDIANCQTCHAGQGAAAAVESTCTMCHGFHQAPFPMESVLRARAAGAAAGGTATGGASP